MVHHLLYFPQISMFDQTRVHTLSKTPHDRCYTFSSLGAPWPLARLPFRVSSSRCTAPGSVSPLEARRYRYPARSTLPRVLSAGRDRKSRNSCAGSGQGRSGGEPRDSPGACRCFRGEEKRSRKTDAQSESHGRAENAATAERTFQGKRGRSQCRMSRKCQIRSGTEHRRSESTA